jgi:hypothetical protein
VSTFRKKPVEIEAREFSGQTWGVTAESLIGWCGGRYEGEEGTDARLVISTIEGEMTASPGDWIICGVQGEFYPCKPDIFAETYDRVDETAEAVDRAATKVATARYFTASEHPVVVRLRDRIIALAAEIYGNVPVGRHQSIALTALEDVQMRANRGIFAPPEHR